MHKTKKAFALKDFDETRILQRRYFKDFHFAADQSDAEILQSLTASDLPLETLEQNQKTIRAVHGRLHQFHELLSRHQLRFAKFNKRKAEKLGIKVAALQVSDGGAPTIEYVTAEWSVIELVTKFEKSYSSLEKTLQKKYRAEFASRLKRARLAAGLTQKELGDMIQISHIGCSQYERGQRDPSIPTLFRLNEIFPNTEFLRIK